MRKILVTCIGLETLAASTYRSLAAHCADAALADTFESLAAEEEEHVAWWRELLDAWDQGLIPDVVNDPERLLDELLQVHEDVSAAVPVDVASLTPAQMVEIAAHLEFFMLDPVFAELLDLTEPGRTGHHREAYAQHIERLVSAIETSTTTDSLARFLARVLKRALRDNVALAAYATHDPLTGLFNRRGLISHLRQWVSWAYRYDRPLMVLLIDVDEFKRVNDEHGHAVGDAALVCVAEALRDSTRQSDLIARYGGDEFAIVAPETDAEEYASLSHRILTSVRDIRCPDWDGVPVKLAVSIGGAVLTPRGAHSERVIDIVLAGADSSLYEAKSSGRDRAGWPVLVTGTESVG
ncbi:MAG: GGDEF domain-containing protein [Coriobacteriia bacterium]|nr:GGDEF domain-containing protein [Coriobacteriia bacterium]